MRRVATPLNLNKTCPAFGRAKSDWRPAGTLRRQAPRRPVPVAPPESTADLPGSKPAGDRRQRIFGQSNPSLVFTAGPVERMPGGESTRRSSIMRSPRLNKCHAKKTSRPASGVCRAGRDEACGRHETVQISSSRLFISLWWNHNSAEDSPHRRDEKLFIPLW